MVKQLTIRIFITNKKGVHDIVNLCQILSWGSLVELDPTRKPPTVCFILVGGQNAASGRTQKSLREPAWLNL